MTALVRPAHTGVPRITSRYSPRGRAVSTGATGQVLLRMASSPQRSQPRQPLRSTPSRSSTSSASRAEAISSMAFLVFPVRE